MSKITALGERREIELRQGSTLLFRQTLTDAATGLPLNLTGCAVRGQVRRKALAPDPEVASFAITIAPDPTEGWYEAELTDEVTVALSCGDTIADPASLYEYDIELEDASGRVLCLLYGPLRVRPEVTR